MSNETDLDWLARNVHVWREGAYAAMRGVVERVIWIGASAYGQMPELKSSVTRDQWLARRAELQNKPSWDDAHEWARCLSQDYDGAWWWYQDVPEKCEDGWWSELKCKPAEAYGEVLGDWRDTLERRPEYTKECADGEWASPVAAEFQPITSIEDNQELSMSKQQEVKQDNGWFERGELPPAGVVCEMKHKHSKPNWARPGFEPVIIVASGKELFITSGTVFYNETVGAWGDYEFRPIRTERELAIEEMCRVVGLHVLVFEVQAGKLYDAGYRKDPK